MSKLKISDTIATLSYNNKRYVFYHLIRNTSTTIYYCNETKDILVYDYFNEKLYLGSEYDYMELSTKDVEWIE